MKAAILGGALALAMWGGAALAQNDSTTTTTKDCPDASMQTNTNGQTSASVSTDDCARSQQLQTGTGGSGSVNADDNGVDVNGQMNSGSDTTMQGSSTLGTDDQQPATGGSGDATQAQPQGSTVIIENNDNGQQAQPQAQPQPTTTAPSAAVTPVDDSYRDEKVKDKDENLRGVTVLLGGGVEGYTGDLAPEINPGPAWGVGLAMRPSKVLGIELGYTGAVNSVDDAGAERANDADIVRNGGQAVATVGLSASPVQPYLLGGIGIDRYNVRNAEGMNFHDDTIGNVPVGLGIRTQAGAFTADLRGQYGILFDQGFAPSEGRTNVSDATNGSTPTGRYGATLRLGATF